METRTMSQSDEERAREIMRSITHTILSVRAEATLAGAVAERDRIADWAEKTFVNGPVNIAAAIRARK